MITFCTHRYTYYLLPSFISGTIHETYNGKGYWFSWKDSSNNQERDWLDGRNFCRQRCMDLVSLETSPENEFIKSRILESRFLIGTEVESAGPYFENVVFGIRYLLYLFMFLHCGVIHMEVFLRSFKLKYMRTCLTWIVLMLL